MKAKKSLIITIVLAVLTLSLGLIAFAGCSKADITISGSSSVSPLMSVLADKYEEANDGVKIKIITSESGPGITDTMNNKNDFGMASRGLKDSEKGVTSKKLCDDGIVMIAHKDSTVSNVTGEEVFDLYKDGTAIGEITNAIARNSTSGTRSAFDSMIKKGDKKLSDVVEFSSKVGVESSTSTVITSIAGNKSTIGYISLGSYKADQGIKKVQFEGVDATVDNIKEGKYELAREFNLIFKEGRTVSSKVQAFLDFIFSAEGKAIIEAEGYIA